MKLKECCTIIAGQSPESSTYNIDGNGLPFFQGKAEFGGLYPTIKNFCSQPKKIAEKNDILLSVRAPIGPTNLAPSRVCIGRGLSAIRPNPSILHLKFLLYFFRYIEKFLSEKGTGTTFKAITQDVVKNIEVPEMSLEEQERIVNRIEELFSELDSAVETLKKTKEQLAVYRQSVLKDAFGSIEHKIKLAELAERIFDGPFGSNLKSIDYISEGIRVVRLENLKEGWFDDSKQSFVSEEKYETIKSHTVYPSDLIMSTFISDSIKICQMPSYINYAVNKADCIGIRLKLESVTREYVMYYLLSRKAYMDLEHQIHGATRPRVNTTQIKQLHVPICSLDEQKKIVSQIESRLSVCDNIEKTVSEALSQADVMRQSILKKAFEGGL